MDMQGLKFSKPRPRALEKADRARKKQSVEDRENATVRIRSTGQCEVRIQVDRNRVLGLLRQRCLRRSSEIHHMLGGSGRRGVGESAEARNKLHVCSICHDLITRHILQPHWTDVQDRAGTVTFIRLK